MITILTAALLLATAPALAQQPMTAQQMQDRIGDLTTDRNGYEALVDNLRQQIHDIQRADAADKAKALAETNAWWCGSACLPAAPPEAPKPPDDLVTPPDPIVGHGTGVGPAPADDPAEK